MLKRRQAPAGSPEFAGACTSLTDGRVSVFTRPMMAFKALIQNDIL
jgi:hypothetical protein